MNAISYLDRFLDPVTEAMTPGVAEVIVGLRASPELLAEIEPLRLKANQGALTEAETEAYRDFVEAVDVLSILQLKARRSLQLDLQV